MDPHMKIDTERNVTTAHPIYLIQLNPNLQAESQAIPLHILENDLALLPLLQQKHDQPLLLLESTKVPYVYQEKEHGNTLSNDTFNTPMPVTSTTIKNSRLYLTDDYLVQGSAKECIQNILVTPDPLPNCDNNDAPDHTLAKHDKRANNLNIDVINTAKTYRSNQKIKNYVHISDVKAPPRAIAVLPAALQIRRSLISPRRTLSFGVRFGPVQGIRKSITRSEAQTLLSSSTTPVFLLNQNEDCVTHIDVSDKDKSNWMGLLPFGDHTPVTSSTSANVWLYEDNNELFGITTQPICARRPLRLGYSKKYVEDHDIPPGPPVLDLEEVHPVQWWCNECNRAMQSAAMLLRHDVYHKDYISSTRSFYRCRHCRRPFGRLCSLKRHMLRNCLKKPQVTLEKNQQLTETIQSNAPDISSVLEDNRIPSDESFQNFTNSLDFSTNLFDTDRIAGLDISNNSRADSELNPYSIGFRDETGLSSDLGFTKLSAALENVQSGETDHVPKEPLSDMCAYCNQVVVKGNKIKHLSNCPSRLICECGRVFRHKKSLTRHMHKCHDNVNQEKQLQVQVNRKPEANEKDMAYKCQECPLGFKRRGMLVNHLWRVHKIISTMPVEKKVRHYPCTICTKIYRSATKRDGHVRAHHPGVDKPLRQWIEGGVKSCQPASCTECPRQYASRAKLLQHVRQQHPHLAKMMKNQAMKKLHSKSKHQSHTRANPTQEKTNCSSNSRNMLSWNTD